VPYVLPELTSEGAIAMEYIADTLPIDDPELDPLVRARALRVGLRALYEMIFIQGFLHCDYHAGNLRVTSTGQLVLLDCGYVATLTSEARGLFGDFFLAIALNDAQLATRVTLALADTKAPCEVASLERELAGLIDAVHGIAPRDFQITEFVLSLFEIQHRHHLQPSADFTMAIMALLSYEGLLKTYVPELDFQREAMPYLVRAADEKRDTRWV
jgi:ubiquinone biosynthesis protein